MFESIASQEHAVNQLEKALNNPVNTYAFYGSRGTFVEEAARIFASRLLDEKGSCDDRVQSKLHADVIEFEPAGVAYRVKEDVRQSMLGEIRKSPIEGSRKVLIVHDAHLLREDSANTLLKSLEEPPDNFFWILVAPSPDSLIATIRSRSFAIQFSRLNDEVIEEILVNEGVAQDRAKYIASISSGRIDRARKFVTDYLPIRDVAQKIVTDYEINASYVTKSVAEVTGIFEEITSDIGAKNKKKMDEIKSELKDSGYADKIIQSIVTTNKNYFEATEKKLKNELMVEFLDALEYSFRMKAKASLESGDNSEVSKCVFACEQIETFRKRLLFNPSESLFLESLLASISLY